MTAFAFNVIKYFICFLSPREKKLTKLKLVVTKILFVWSV